jgi:hypothetical protein
MSMQDNSTFKHELEITECACVGPAKSDSTPGLDIDTSTEEFYGFLSEMKERLEDMIEENDDDTDTVTRMEETTIGENEETEGLKR